MQNKITYHNFNYSEGYKDIEADNMKIIRLNQNNANVYFEKIYTEATHSPEKLTQKIGSEKMDYFLEKYKSYATINEGLKKIVPEQNICYWIADRHERQYTHGEIKGDEAILWLDFYEQFKHEISDVRYYLESLEKLVSILYPVRRERIEKIDMTELNEEIQRMNKDGWSMKQMTNINSGRHYCRPSDNFDYGYSAGFNFTEGVMILWEKIK